MDLPPEPPGRVTQLLTAARAGKAGALDEVFALVFDELRRLANVLLERERADHTLQPTALVHELWLKLGQQHSTAIEDHDQFLQVAAQAMRRILVDHARTRGRVKRGSGAARVPLDDAMLAWDRHAIDLLALDEALDQLGLEQPRMAQLVELRFFGGLDSLDAARVLGVGLRTCERDWTLARAWLRRRLAG